MFSKFLQHLKDKGLTKEAESLQNLQVAGKSYQKKVASELEWLLPAIKHPDRRLTYQDVRDYYNKMQRQFRVPGENVLGFWSDKIEPFQFTGTLDDHIESKLLGLHSLFDGGKSKNICIDIIPGKNVEASRVRKHIVQILELLGKIPTLLSKQVLFDGDRGYHIFGMLKDVEDLKILRQVLTELLTDYVSEHRNVALGEGKDDEIIINLDSLRNMGSVPVPYTLNPKTGLVILPVDDIEGFNASNAEMKEVLKKFSPLVEEVVDEDEVYEEDEDFEIEASSKIRTLSAASEFDPDKVSTVSANIGSIHIDSKLDTKKVKDALKHVQETDTNAFGKVRDFDYIISDITAKEVGITVPAGAAAWFMPHYPDVCFIKKDVVSSKSIEELGSILVHEAQHGRYPGYGEWTAESAESRFQQASLLVRQAQIKIIAAEGGSRQEIWDYARYLSEKISTEKSHEIIAEAKKVNSDETWYNFKQKYMKKMSAEQRGGQGGQDRDLSQIIAAYALPAAKIVLENVYSSVDPNITMDILSTVMFDSRNRYGLTHALMTYSPEKGTSLNTYIYQQINFTIKTALTELFGKGKQQSKSLSEGVGGDEGESGRELGEMVARPVTDDDVDKLVEEIDEVIGQLRAAIRTWKSDASDVEVTIGKDSKRSVRLYDTPEQAEILFNYYLSSIGLSQVDEFVEKQPLTTKEDLLASRGFFTPTGKCLDCGQRYSFEKDWESKVSELENEGCRKKREAPEHQVGWTDNTYNAQAAQFADYKYRLGYERQTAGSNEHEPVIAKFRRGLSVFALDLEELEELEQQKPKPKPTRPSLSLEDVEDVERETSKIKDVQIQKNEYVKSLKSNSYEAKRLQGKNLEIMSPRETSQAIDDTEVQQLVDAFKNRLESKVTTKKKYAEFKELVSDLLQMKFMSAAQHEVGETSMPKLDKAEVEE